MLTLCPSHSWNPMGLFFLVLVCLFVCFCFLEIFATSAFCPKLPKTNGKNKQTMKVYEWLAHVYSVTSHAYHPRVHFLLIFSWCVLMFSWFGHRPESYLKPWEEMHHSRDLKIESAN